MEATKQKIGLLADFNAQNLAVLLERNSPAPGASCEQAPFGQAIPILLDKRHDFWRESFHSLVVWTLPQSVSTEFQRVLTGEAFSKEKLLLEVDSYCSLIKAIPETVRTIAIPSWVTSAADRGMGPLSLRNRVGLANALMRMNLHLADCLEDDPRILLLDSQLWLRSAGPNAHSPKLWYLSKTPFQTEVFQEASKDIASAFSGIRGSSKKVLVLDLDNTLWGGVLGEVGWENLRLGGHDGIGEAFVDFQRQLKRLVARGVLLAISSKNEEAAALEAIRLHPEMLLRLEDFAAWRINWNDKAANIESLMVDLNLGLDSVVFLDDSAVERARVREALPQVAVPDLPDDPMQYASFLGRIRYFDNPIISKEDRERSRMYAADRERSASKLTVKSLDEWLLGLNLRIEVEPLRESNLERAAQLFNKTNQMNLSTRRLAPGELLAWSRASNRRLWTYRFTDRFGDYGLCGISSLSQEGSRGTLVDFILSCRAMGRGVEETMLITSARFAKEMGCLELHAEYVPTAKNQPCSKWLQGLQFLVRDGNAYKLSTLSPLNLPSHVTVILAKEDEKIVT
jgi:FkbH-like protein